MSVTAQEQQLEKDHCNLKDKRVVHLKYVLNFYFKNIVSPGSIPENMAILGSYMAVSLTFILDVLTDPTISFHLLYVFPLIFIALHSSRNCAVIVLAVFSISIQLVELLYFHNQALEIQVNLFLIIAFSNSTCAIIARYSRADTLEAKRLSTIDPLTQLNNRLALKNALDAEVLRQRRYGEHFSVAMIDLDGFKGLNDSMGHKAGDKALVVLADILRSHTRQTDTIARQGGDEFVVLMPNTKAIDSDVLCNSLCHAVGERLTEEMSYPITASIGVVTIEHWTEVSGDILAVADKALYRAKANGKNIKHQFARTT